MHYNMIYVDMTCFLRLDHIIIWKITSARDKLYETYNYVYAQIAIEY